MISRKIILLSSTILLLFIISNGYAEVQVNRDLASNTGEEVKVVPIETPALLVDSANDQARLLAAENSLILLNDVVRRLSSSHHSTQPHGSSTHVPSIHSSTHVPSTHSSTHVPSTQSSTRATQSSTHQPSTHTSTRLTNSSPHPSSTRHSTAITRTTRNTRASTTKTSKHTTPRPSSTRRRGTSKTTEATTTIDYPYTPYVPKEDNNYNYYDLKGKYRPRGGYNNNDDRSDDRSDDDDDDDDNSRDNYKDKEDMYASMTIWIRDADNWENQRYPNRYPGKKYNKNKDYEGVKFPVRHYKNIRKFPREKFSPLVSILPWLPIFYDRITYQTIIFSPAGGIYILPPLINFYGRRFAVAQLIKWGYASLVSSGAPPPPNVNVAPLVQPAPAAVPAPGAPVFDAKKERFVGGVKTEYANFEPRYSQTIKEGGRGYGNGGNYGGTGRQEVYARGGPQPGGGYN